MKKLGEILASHQPFSEIVIGNAAIARAMLEAGVRVVTSYPGSPTPEIAEALNALPKESQPPYFEFSVNEKVATEVAVGASVNGHLSCTFFKSVGLNVAADTFVQLGLMELIGGMVILLGDDPGANSSQNEQDNRHYARLAYIPVFEPANAQEAYEMFKEAAALSQKRRMPVIVRLTTHVCHAKAKVRFQGWQPRPLDNTPRFDVKNGPYIPISASVFPLKRRALEKLSDVAAYADASSFNAMTDFQNGRRGVITMGAPFLSLMDALEDVTAKPDILKLGIIHPLAKEKTLAFLRQHEEVKILEELDDVLEREIKALAFEHGLPVRIIGKKDIDDWLGEYTPDKVAQVLYKTWPDLLAKDEAKGAPVASRAPRPPQLCPGCGHRSAFYAVKQALKESDITVADIGCHTLGFLPPHQMGQILLCMGHSSATASGLSLFNQERRVVAFLGDSTFFHAGIPGIINAVFNRHNLLLIIMENGTTAMTGHQDHPGVGKNANGATDAIPLRRVLDALGVTNIREVDAYQQSKLRSLVEEALLESGFKVIIAKHPCMLKLTKEMRRRGQFRGRRVTIAPTCDQQHACIAAFACPTFQRTADRQVSAHQDLCIGDGSCLQTCPTHAILAPSDSAAKGGASHD
ncbi:thiamine pyrophosphate-dependent enzyme [Azotosporobacter soli]|uniref:thiamine pyrophosphate-dependent enzyme n=1 Tax=Azotosporobacter soli TaxID=3055040 RepID=UPI0031FE9344